MESSRHRRRWLEACSRRGWVEWLQSRGAWQEGTDEVVDWTRWFRHPPDRGSDAARGAGCPATTQSAGGGGSGGGGGGGRGPNTQAEPVTSVIWATSPARSPAAAVHNEGGEVRPLPGCADGPCTEEADKECFFGWGETKGYVKQMSVRGTQRSVERGGCEVSRSLG